MLKKINAFYGTQSSLPHSQEAASLFIIISVTQQNTIIAGQFLKPFGQGQKI